MSNLGETDILATAQSAVENRTQRVTRIVLNILAGSSDSMSSEKIWKAFQQQAAKNPAAFGNIKSADIKHILKVLSKHNRIEEKRIAVLGVYHYRLGSNK